MSDDQHRSDEVAESIAQVSSGTSEEGARLAESCQPDSGADRVSSVCRKPASFGPSSLDQPHARANLSTARSHQLSKSGSDEHLRRSIL